MSMTANTPDYLHKEYPKRFARDDFWSQIKRTVNGVPVPDFNIQLMIRQIKNGLQLHPNDFLLDLGCGNGALANRLNQDLRGYVGVDFSSYLLGIAMEHFPGPEIQYLNFDIRNADKYCVVAKQTTKVMVYGVLSYLSRPEVISLLKNLKKRLPNLKKIFVGNLPDREVAASFFAKRNIASYELDNAKSPIGVWWTQSQIRDLGRILGFKTTCWRMPIEFYGSEYRFDVVFDLEKQPHEPPEPPTQNEKLRVDSPTNGSLNPHVTAKTDTQKNSSEKPKEIIFDPPISTSNLFAPSLDRVWEHFSNRRDDTSLVTKLEHQLNSYHQSRFCVTFNSGFWALVASVVCKAIPSCSEVIIPSFTYRRLADVVFWSGKTPVMVDVDPSSLAICPQQTQAAINPNTALILAVHPIVNCCDVNTLKQVANENHVPVIFDAVESVHETVAGVRVGNHGVGEVFSFHASKLINGLEGGYVTTNDSQFAQKLRRFRDSAKGLNPTDRTLSSSLNPAHAAFALASLNELTPNLNHLKQIYREYQVGLKDIPGIQLLEFDESEQTSFKNIVIRLSNPFPLSRDELVTNLNRLGALARPHYSPALHQREHRFDTNQRKLNTSDDCSTSFVNLPCGARVSTDDVQEVCSWLRQAAVGQLAPTHQLTNPKQVKPQACRPIDDGKSTKCELQKEQDIFEAIYKNGYFTNHGPLACLFESRVAAALQMDHSVAISSESLALLVALAATENRGRVLVPSDHLARLSQIAAWLSLSTHEYKAAKGSAVNEQIQELTQSPGTACLIIGQDAIVNENEICGLIEDSALPVFRLVSSLERAMVSDCVHQVVSLGTNIHEQSAGGVIVTNDPIFADRCRNIRSSYGAPKVVSVVATCNGRFSEYQAGRGLIELALAIDGSNKGQP